MKINILGNLLEEKDGLFDGVVDSTPLKVDHELKEGNSNI